MSCQLRLDVIEPPKFRFSHEDHRLVDKRPGELFRATDHNAAEISAAQGFEVRARGPPLRADELEDIHPRKRRRERKLDREFIPGAGGAFDRRCQPCAGLAAAGIRDLPVDVSGLVGCAPLNEAVALEPLESAVDLADVERRARSGATFELRPQLIAVARPLRQDRQQALPHRHSDLPERDMHTG